jgi:dTDP-glucose 4,6-dehydratase
MKLIPSGYTVFHEDLESVALALEPQFSDFDGARIFITGGTGFFGIWLLECLLWIIENKNLNLQLFILSRNPNVFLAKRAPHLHDRNGLTFIEGSLTDFKFPDVKLTHIIHAASEPNIEHSENWAQGHIRSSIDGIKNLLELAAMHRIKSMLTITSGAVYSPMDSVIGGLSKEGPSNIDDYHSDRIVYGQSKRMMEVMSAVAARAGSFKATIARCFCFVGPYLALNANYAVGNFIRDALKGDTIVINGDGTPMRSYLYPTDLVVWLMTILNKGESGRPYNVGGDVPISIAELAKLVAAISGNHVEINIKQIPANGPINYYLPDLTRVFNDLGLSVSIDLKTAIDKTFSWYRGQ